MATVLALALMVFSFFAIARHNRKPVYQPTPTYAYFADPATGEVFTALVESEIQTAPSGQQALRVYVFSCGDCNDPQQQFVGWVEKLELREAPPGGWEAWQNARQQDGRPGGGQPGSAPVTDPAAGSGESNPASQEPSDSSESVESPPSAPADAATSDSAAPAPAPAPPTVAPSTSPPTTPPAVSPSWRGMGSPTTGAWPRYRRYIRRADATEWVRARSPEGAAIMEETFTRCGPDRGGPMPCAPPQPNARP